MARISGRVIDEQELPVAGAKVWIEPGAQVVTTDGGGAFAAEVTEGRTYRVSARTGEHHVWSVMWRAEHPEEPIVLRLRLGITFIAYVFADRAPVANARVRFRHGIEGTSDDSGRVEIVGLPPTLNRGYVSAEGRADEWFFLHVDEDPGGLVERDITMQPGSRIAGVVVDSHGTPVADAVVQGESADGTRYHDWTRPDGTWQFSVRAGTCKVGAWSEQHGGSDELTFESDGSARSEVVLRFASTQPSPARPRIAGVVVEQDGTPAAGVEIHIIGAYGSFTDMRGRFATEVLDAQVEEYEAVARRLGPGRSKGVRQRVRAGDTNVRLAIAKGATVTGRVLFDGEPVPYFALRMLRERVWPAGGPAFGMRAADGRFVVPHVGPGTWRVAVLTPNTRIATSEEFVIANDEMLDVGDISLVSGQPLEGCVRDRVGAVVAGARVMVGMSGLPDENRTVLQRLFTGHYETRTDDHGRYRFEGLEIRGHVIDSAVEPRDIICASHFKEGISAVYELSPSHRTQDLVLHGFARIEGTVENTGDRYISVGALRDGEPVLAWRHAFCNNGRFTFEDTPPGEYVVCLRDEKAVSQRVVVGIDQTARVTLTSSGEPDPPTSDVRHSVVLIGPDDD